jgi:hypothetical protein
VQFQPDRRSATGRIRPISSFTDRAFNLSYRHDIPSTDWAYGGNANYTIRSWRTG